MTAVLVGSLVVAGAPAALAKRPARPAASCVGDTIHGYLGDTIAETFSVPAGTPLRSVDIRLGFAQAWRGTLTAQIVRTLPLGATLFSAQLQTLASGASRVSGRALTYQWVHFTFAPSVAAPADPAASRTPLAVQVVGLPGLDGRGNPIAAWIRCSSTDASNAVLATANVFLPGDTVSTPVLERTVGTAAYRVWSTP